MAALERLSRFWFASGDGGLPIGGRINLVEVGKNDDRPLETFGRVVSNKVDGVYPLLRLSAIFFIIFRFFEPVQETAEGYGAAIFGKLVFEPVGQGQEAVKVWWIEYPRYPRWR